MPSDAGVGQPGATATQRSSATATGKPEAIVIQKPGANEQPDARFAGQSRALPQARPDASSQDIDGDADADRALSQAAWARVRWPGGDVIESHDAARLDEPVLAGSLFKLIAARAAIEHGVITPDAAVVCPRRVETHGRRADCVHPDLGRPLTLDDAIAYSCNHYFVRLAERLDRPVLASSLHRLSNGASGPLGDAPLPLVVLGLEGPRLGMSTWLRTVLRALEPPVSSGHLAGAVADAALFSALRRGAARAASEGTASALGDQTMLTLAKTGTVLPKNGSQEGRLVAWRPEIEEAIVVRAAGVAGRDAARIARAAWDRATASGERVVRVGRVRESGPTAVGPTRVDTVPLEAYVAGVVAGEGDRAMPAVALRALAVAARSYGVAPDGRHTRHGYDVCDTTHCQVQVRATAWSRGATESTRGLVFWAGGRAVAVPYSASCSGRLLPPELLWGPPDGASTGASVRRGTGVRMSLPPLTRVGAEPAPHDVPSWRTDVTVTELEGVLRRAGYRGDVLRSIAMLEQTSDGVPTRLAFGGFVPAEIDASTFRHLIGRGLGWHVLKSHAWQVTRSGRGYRFTGRGKGHGAGLCLAGASAMARRNAALRDVVAAYVPLAGLASLQDRFVWRLPSILEGQASRLGADARATMADLRVRLGVWSPRDVEVRVHPTIEAYQRVTGRAWWTAASTRRLRAGSYRIDLPLVPGADAPSKVIAALRHEFVHVLTQSTLAGDPLWESEGLATLASRDVSSLPSADGPESGALPVAASCPDDLVMARPGSLEAMRAVYSQSADCAIRLLPTGLGAWRTLALR